MRDENGQSWLTEEESAQKRHEILESYVSLHAEDDMVTELEILARMFSDQHCQGLLQWWEGIHPEYTKEWAERQIREELASESRRKRREVVEGERADQRPA